MAAILLPYILLLVFVYVLIGAILFGICLWYVRALRATDTQCKRAYDYYAAMHGWKRSRAAVAACITVVVLWFPIVFGYVRNPLDR